MRPIALSIIASLFVFRAAQAQTPAFDMRGWTKLGEHTVSGTTDRDRVTVGRVAGQFRRLMLIVLDGDLELLDFKVTLRTGMLFEPVVGQFFREGTRTRALELPDPGAPHVIEYVDLTYRRAGSTQPRVELWGQDMPPPPPPWDPKGWTRLADYQLKGTVDGDQIPIPAQAGLATKLSFVVLDGDVEITGLTVGFARGESFTGPYRLRFQGAARYHEIVFRNLHPPIQQIDFKAAKIGGGFPPASKVQIWAVIAKAPLEAKPKLTAPPLPK